MRIDEFESQFIRSTREPFKFHSPEISTVAVVSDSPQSGAAQVLAASTSLLSDTPVLGKASSKVSWQLIHGELYDSVRALLNIIEDVKPDVIFVERHLKTKIEDRVIGLSNYIDALTQSCITPLVILPECEDSNMANVVRPAKEILVDSKQLVGNHNLINWALRFVVPDTKLFLSHIEDDRDFAHYINVISRIPELDTDLAEKAIRGTLLKIPEDFIDRVRSGVEKLSSDISVKGIIRLGHSIADHLDIIQKHKIDLLVVPGASQERRMLSETTYGLAMECREIPILVV
jgi:hypothetical protein